MRTAFLLATIVSHLAASCASETGGPLPEDYALSGDALEAPAGVDGKADTALADLPRADWHNIVNLNVGYGYQNVHVDALRPFRGDLLRITIPQTCNLQILGMNLHGRTTGGLPLLLGGRALLATAGGGESSFYYEVNGGSPATIYSMDVLINHSTLGCQVSFEQALSSSIEGGDVEPEPAACRATGCGGTICADEDVVSICVAQPGDECYALARCERQYDGDCGFSRTRAADVCFARYGM
jgi:hypothetical protein